MYSNTITLTINAVDKILLRVNQDNFGSEYRLRSSTEKLVMKIRHSVENSTGQSVNRHNVYVEHTIFAVPDTSLEQFVTYSFTIRERDGTTLANAEDLVPAVNTAFSSLIDTLVQGEN